MDKEPAAERAASPSEIFTTVHKSFQRALGSETALLLETRLVWRFDLSRSCIVWCFVLC